MRNDFFLNVEVRFEVRNAGIPVNYVMVPDLAELQLTLVKRAERFT